MQKVERFSAINNPPKAELHLKIEALRDNQNLARGALTKVLLKFCRISKNEFSLKFSCYRQSCQKILQNGLN